MRISKLFGAVLALALAATGCGGGINRDDERLQRGVVVVGTGQEPPIINPWLSEGNLQATYSIALSMLYPLWRVTPDFRYEPLLLEGEPEITQDPFTVTYRLKQEATWSDGVPITAHDILFTLQTCLNPDFAIAVRAGCEKVDMAASQVVDDKTFRMVFTEPYAPWKSLFSSGPGAILPAHELAGKDFDEIWDDEITVSSGPLKFGSWNKGRDMTLVRNERFWGETQAPEQVVLRFIEDSTVQVQALRGGEIDVLSSQPQLDLVEQVREVPGVQSEVVAGGSWEFFEINHGVPGLDAAHAFVREAIALAVNREELVRALIGPMNPEAEPLQSLVYVNTQAEYDPAFARWRFDPDAARRLLDEAGCLAGEDGIRTCGDGVRLSFDYGYTAGNELRELQFVVLQSYLKDVGIEITPQPEDSATYFGETWPSGEDGRWQLFNQAWVGAVDPNPALSLWECGGEMNYRSSCNEEVSALIAQSRTELDPARRAELLNRANAVMAQELPALPLYQTPSFVAWSTALQGPATNPTDWGYLWNVERWRIA